MDKKRFLAIVPARGGSKRLPRKNMLELSGYPLIYWTIKAAKESRYIDEVVVTSDDDEILNFCSGFSVETIKRPDYLAMDSSSTFDTLVHAISKLNDTFDYILLLQPTSPLRVAEHIDEAIELLVKKQSDAVISVCEVEHSPLWANTLPADGNMEEFIHSKIRNKRSQDLPVYYRLNGAIYICSIARLLDEKTLFISSNIYSYVMAQSASIDIDNLIDFKIASFLKET